MTITDSADFVGELLHNVAVISTTTDEVSRKDNSDDHDNTVLISQASISGYVWHDVDEDVVIDAGENGLNNVRVSLQGSDIFGNPINVTATTDDDGAYAFTGLNPGAYTLNETQPDNFASTGASIGSNGGTLNGSDTVETIAITSGDQAVQYNFGEDFGVSIGDRVWYDADRDGIQDDGEVGVEDVLVYLYRDTNADNAFTAGTDTYVASMFTDATGDYQFDALTDGD